MHASRDVDFVDARRDYDLWVSCDDCGDVLVHAELCALRGHEPNGRHALCYPCSECGLPNALELVPEEVEGLRQVGFIALPMNAPGELLDEHPAGAAFEWDDVLALHELLNSTDAIAELAAR